MANYGFGVMDNYQGPYDMPIDQVSMANRLPPSFMQRAGKALSGFNNPDLAMALLANSGYSPQKRSFGEILGTSMMQANQMKSGREDEAFKRKYMEAQMAAMGGNTRKPVVIAGPDGKPIYVAESDAIGKSPFLQGSANDGIGQYNPRDYTPKSWAAFLQDKDPSKLERYESPRQEFKPSFRNVTRTLPDGSTQIGSYDTSTGMYNWNGDIVPAGTKPRADAMGKAIGEAEGAQTAKAPVKASMDYVISQFEPILEKTMQGGLFGASGKAGTVLDKKDKERFENLREQMSTELRTVFRIPGEGTLTEKEQQQYGVQLPHTDNEVETNRQILKDIRERIRLRLGGDPAGDKPAAPKAPSIGEVRGGYRFKGGDPSKQENWVRQ